MPRPIHCILLIDDDPDDNFLHQVVIEDSGLCDHVRIAENGTEALRYLSNPNQPDYLQPDLILTDINLPGMNGFEFLEQYHQLTELSQRPAVVLVLTTSLTPRDNQQAALLPCVSGCYTKPLTTNMLRRIVAEHHLALPNNTSAN